MIALSRRAALAALLTLAPLAAARASGGGGSKEPGEAFVKLSTINLEYWDENGLFHIVNMELTAVFPTQTSLNKKVAVEITHTLAAMTWEEFSHGNPAATVKAIALDAVRKDPSGAACKEVLVTKLIIR